VDRSRWFFHPILIFVASILALGTSLILYIYWYIEASAGLKSVIEKFHLDSDQLLTAQTWVVILVLSILVGMILLGMFIIFAYSQKMVQLYRLQRNFINNFTHELKTPAASLRLFLETFQKHELARDDQLKYIAYMLTDVNRLSDTITRILNLARIESKSFTGRFSWIDPVEVIGRFLEKNHHLFNGCRVRINNAAPHKIYCRINPSLFEILLMNLMTNATTYNASGNPQVDVRVRLRGNRIQIEFKDNGIGFERSERSKIFKKFYQIGRSEDMSAKGSGIGLYLAQNIAKIHRGGLHAWSPGLGQGAVFTLTLPLHQERSGSPA
jgi:two-component system, OmpR family, phosphate regulon sensor histidine kinase PhoR